jgi:hypothetical protein
LLNRQAQKDLYETGFMTIRKRLFLLFVAVLLVAGAGFIIWAETPLGPMPQALVALRAESLAGVPSGRLPT